MDLLGALLGWPSLLAALGLSIQGVRRRRPAAIWIAAVLTTPVAFYVSGSPALPFVGIVPLAALVVTALTCRRQARWPAAPSLAFFVACLIALGYIALVDRRSDEQPLNSLQASVQSRTDDNPRPIP